MRNSVKNFGLEKQIRNATSGSKVVEITHSSGGITSIPHAGGKRITNIYVNADGKLAIDYEV